MLCPWPRARGLGRVCQLLRTDGCAVVDCTFDLFVWLGTASRSQDRRLAVLLAAVLGQQHEAAAQATTRSRAAVTKLFENGESLLFKEKFSDYPGSLTVHMQPQESPSTCRLVRADLFNVSALTADAPAVRGGTVGVAPTAGDTIAARREQPPIDVAALHAPTVWSEPPFDDGSGETQVWIMRQRLKSNNVNMDFEREAIPPDQYGQFYAGDSYIVQYRYQVKGNDKYLLYFWQGRDSSITEKGAAAVESINVSDSLGGDAPQIRVVQGKESRHFLRLFGRTGAIVHLGKQAAPPAEAPVRFYQLRQAEHGEVRCIETASPVEHHAGGGTRPVLAFHSDHVTAILTGTLTYCWIGKNAPADEVAALNRCTVLLPAPGQPAVVVVNEDKEPGDFIKLFTAKDWVDRPVGTRRLKSDVRLFLCSGGSGVVEIDRILPFTQDDLDDHHVMILDAVTEVYAWFGSRATKPEKLIALETMQKLVVDSPRGHRRTAALWVTFPYEEPIGFTRHFHVWSTSQFPADQRNKRTTVLLVETVLAQYQRRVYAYETLVSKQLPDTVDKTRLEDYLSDDDFVRVLGLTRAEFAGLPAWKQSSLKQRHRLY